MEAGNGSVVVFESRRQSRPGHNGTASKRRAGLRLVQADLTDAGELVPLAKPEIRQFAMQRGGSRRWSCWVSRQGPWLRTAPRRHDVPRKEARLAIDEHAFVRQTDNRVPCLGKMATRADNLQRAGYPLVVWNRRRPSRSDRPVLLLPGTSAAARPPHRDLQHDDASLKAVVDKPDGILLPCARRDPRRHEHHVSPICRTSYSLHAAAGGSISPARGCCHRVPAAEAAKPGWSPATPMRSRPRDP